MRVCDASCSVCALLFLGVPRTPSRSSFDRPQTDTQRTSRGVVSLALLVGREYPACLLAPPQPRHFPPWVGVCVCVWVCVEKDGRGERGGGQLPFSPSNPLPPSQGVGSERIVRGWVGMRAWGKARDKNAVWGRVGSYRRGRLARVLGRGARLGVWARGQGWSGWQVGVGRVVGKSGQRCRATLPDVSRGLAGMGISRSPVVG